mgnify:FL=1
MVPLERVRLPPNQMYCSVVTQHRSPGIPARPLPLKKTAAFRGDEKFVPGLKPRLPVLSSASGMPGRPSALTNPPKVARTQPVRVPMPTGQMGCVSNVTELVVGGPRAQPWSVISAHSAQSPLRAGEVSDGLKPSLCDVLRMLDNSRKGNRPQLGSTHNKAPPP